MDLLVNIDVDDTDMDCAAVLEKPVQSSAWGKLALMADPFGHGY